MAEVLVFTSPAALKEYVNKFKSELEEREKIIDKLLSKYEDEVADIEVLKNLAQVSEEKDAIMTLNVAGVPIYVKPNPLKFYSILKQLKEELENARKYIDALEQIAEKLGELPDMTVIVVLEKGMPKAVYMDRLPA